MTAPAALPALPPPSAGYCYYICAACQVTGHGPQLAAGQVRCWCCGQPVPAWRRGARPGPAAT